MNYQSIKETEKRFQQKQLKRFKVGDLVRLPISSWGTSKRYLGQGAHFFSLECTCKDIVQVEDDYGNGVYFIGNREDFWDMVCSYQLTLVRSKVKFVLKKWKDEV